MREPIRLARGWHKKKRVVSGTKEDQYFASTSGKREDGGQPEIRSHETTPYGSGRFGIVQTLLLELTAP